VLLLVSVAAAQTSNVRFLNKGREGQVFAVTDYLTKGKLNLVEFTSPSCPSCGALAPLLSKLAAQSPNLVVNRVIIDRPQAGPGVDWQSPLARQYELRSVPYFKVYDAAGKLVADGEPARKMVAKMLIEADLL
jgi:thiol-disulfide isomerase/thioredoxin